MSTAALVRTDVEQGIATITLDSVQNRNALSGALVAQLLDALTAATTDGAVHAIVLTGAGTVFCSGADLTDPPSNEAGNRFSYPDVLLAMAACPKLVIAKVNGHARAGGLGLIAASDIAMAPGDATFAFTEVRLGLAPAIIAVVCRPVMDPRSFRRYALTGEAFDAVEACRAGLLTAAIEGEDFETTFAELLAAVHLTDPLAVARTKELLGVLPALDAAEALQVAAGVSTELFDSARGREGVAAFRERRRPSWAW